MTSTANTASGREAQPAPVMRRLWQRMGAIYGHRWSSGYGEDAAKEGSAGEVWAKGLAGLSAMQIGAGISAAMASADPWPPTLPQFRALCLGIPSFATVAHQVARPAPEHSRFVRLVWQHIDAWRYKQSSGYEAEKILRGAYEIACEHVMRGGALPEPSLAVAQERRPPPRPARPEVAEAAMREITEKLRACEAVAEAGAAESGVVG